jgi:hypothetical protein
MKTTKILPTLVTAIALPVAVFAQTDAYNTTGSPASGAWGPSTGTYEITLGGNGVSDKDADDSAGGLSGSFGYFFNETLEGVVRQSINYANPDVGGAAWNGSTFLALDQHFSARGALRPFFGVNLGRIYGDTISDTWAAGLEGGAQYYVQPRTFIMAMVQYAWYFDKRDNIDDTFSQGQFLWNVGVGFNF